MKALTLKPDYAAYILHGLKRIETRPRSVGVSFRGDLVIHAGVEMKTVDRDRWRRLCDDYPEIDATFLRANGRLAYPACGVGLCIVTVVDIVPVTDVLDTLTPLEKALGIYSPDDNNPRMAWKLENVRPFDAPIPAKGQLGLWTWKGAA